MGAFARRDELHEGHWSFVALERVLEFGGRVTACLLVSYSVDSLYQISVLLWLSTTVIALNEERLSYIIHHYLPSCAFSTMSIHDSFENGLSQQEWILPDEQSVSRQSIIYRTTLQAEIFNVSNCSCPAEKVLLPFLLSFFSLECFDRSFLDWKPLHIMTFRYRPCWITASIGSGPSYCMGYFLSRNVFIEIPGA